MMKKGAEMMAAMTGLTVWTSGGTTVLPVQELPEGGKIIRFESEPGLLQFSLFLDAAQFDWESLYQVLNVHHNENERTGPWDFELMTARPVVPSYWIKLDGKKLGLWYVQRVSLEDVAAKRFRGRFSMDIRAAGLHELSFEPFRPMKVAWLSARLEADPEDTLRPGLRPTHSPSALPAAQFSDPAFWSGQRRKLETTHQPYQKAMRAVFDWAKQASGGQDAIPVLVAAYHLDGQKEALAQALKLVDSAIELPAWGRPAEDVYGHNGDIGAGAMLRNMALAYHMLGNELGPERKERLYRKLVYQGEAFWVQILLMRDYWGGSLIQDHGRKAVHDFGTAAMCLWGIAPEADRWVSYIVPRIERGLDAAALDGVIPGSSYNGLHMYTDGVMWYRDSLLARTGVDLLGHPSLKAVPSFITTVLDEKDLTLLMVECGDKAPLFGGELFLESMAATWRDGEAARVARVMRDRPAEVLKTGACTAALGLLWGFLAHDPASDLLPVPVRPRRDLRLFEDSGFVQYRNDDTGVALSVKCGPWLGYNTQRRATGPCDMMECLPGAGHFALYLGGRPVLVSPDIGYKLRSAVRSCMLVDGQGQIGDVGYPMSIPSQPHRGDRVEEVRWNPATGEGLIRLDLKRAYPPEAGVAHYTREFRVSTNRSVTCRDYVVLDKPRKLSWLFQIRADAGGTMEGLEGRVGDGPLMRLTPTAAGAELSGCLEPTKVVYSYSSSFAKYNHFRYDTLAPTAAVTADFVFQW